MHKKAGVTITPEQLAKLLLVIISGLILLTIISLVRSNESDIESAIMTCRSTVEAREFAAEYSKGTARSAVPMLCKTIDIEIPEDSYDELARQNFTKAVMMNIADRALDCWYMFGQGVTDKNVFGTSLFSKNRCFTCFTFTIKDERRYNYEPVSPLDFENFILLEPYKPVPRNVPFCLHDEDADSGRCIPSDASECVRKGGFCFDKKSDIQAYLKYEGWSCDSKNEVCYVYENMVESYLEHMVSKAPGLLGLGTPLYGFVESDLTVINSEEENNDLENLLFNQGQSNEYTISDDVKQFLASLQKRGFNKDELYGISFISNTKDWGKTILGAAGAVVAIAGGVVVAKGFVVVGVISTITGSASAGAGGLWAVYDYFKDDDVQTIYISTLEDIEDACSVRDDFNQ